MPDPRAQGYQNLFDETAKAIQRLDDSALTAAGDVADNADSLFRNANKLSYGNPSVATDAVGKLPNIFNYGDDDYRKLNRFEGLCGIAEGLSVGNYVGYRDVNGADILLSGIPLMPAQTATDLAKLKLLQSYVLMSLPFEVFYLEIIYRPNHLGKVKLLPRAKQYRVGAVFDERFIVLGPADKELEIQQLLSPDVQATLLAYPRNIGIAGGYMVSTFGGYFYSLDAKDKVVGKRPGGVRDQIMDSYLIFQQLLEQLDPRYRVKNSYRLVQLGAGMPRMLKTNRRKRIIFGTISALIVIVLVVGSFIYYYSMIRLDDSIKSQNNQVQAPTKSGKPDNTYINWQGMTFDHSKSEGLAKVEDYGYSSSGGIHSIFYFKHGFSLTPLSQANAGADPTGGQVVAYTRLAIKDFSTSYFEKDTGLGGVFYPTDDPSSEYQYIDLKISMGKKECAYQRLIGYMHDYDQDAKKGKTSAQTSSAGLDTPVYLCSDTACLMDMAFSYGNG
ncbi:MAG: hypothetical protein LBL67_06200 [Coriobacteriales bacterium]|jgi:hypothetical protein|nr:hypothetical protein [Coriobacteriales bacterium]